MLRTIFEPDTKVGVIGLRRSPIRAYGAIVSDIGVAVAQHPGATAERGGDVSIHVGSVNIVARMVASLAGSWGRHCWSNGGKAGAPTDQALAADHDNAARDAAVVALQQTISSELADHRAEHERRQIRTPAQRHQEEQARLETPTTAEDFASEEHPELAANQQIHRPDLGI
ncbi:hypothetical protein AB0H20_21665 [Nocardia fluminea]|uniref:hypothetical protein n=1 Tax=Nocardia fluminea TaxID=134984 RepID=UPI0033CE7D6A